MEQTFFESLYTRFFLRDFLGKIIPGSGLILWLAKEVTSGERLLSVLEKIPTGCWIVGAGIGWLTGLALQSLGELTGLVLYWPAGARDPLDRMVAFDAKASEGMRDRVERLRVMKDACGTGAVVFLLMLVVTIGKFVWMAVFEKTPIAIAWGNVCTEVFITFAMFWLLQRMHRQHVDRQDRMMSSVLNACSRPDAELQASTGEAKPSNN